MWWLLQSSANDPVSLLQWGVLGAVLFLLITGYLHTKPSVDDLKKRYEQDRELWEKRLIPSIEKLNRAIEMLVNAEQEINKNLERLIDQEERRRERDR